MGTSQPEQFDAIVIGAGQAGGPLASALANAGRRTALIESKHVGGTCINEGCTPTKTMVASARAAYVVGREADFGVHSGPVRIDMQRVRQRKRDIVRDFRFSSERQILGTRDLTLIYGAASFTGPKQLHVLTSDGAERTLVADLIFINAGARPTHPPLNGLSDVLALDSTSIMELDIVPSHLIVLGGGYVGLEFAQMFRRFGSRVTIIQRGEQLLPREDPDIAAAMADILREDGIEIRLGTTLSGVQTGPQGTSVIAHYESSDSKGTIDGSHLLLAVGRTPNSDTIKLDAAGIASDRRGFIPVDDRLQTNVPGVYALGDITGGPAFTHISYDDFRIIRTNLIESGDATTRGRLVPYTIFTDPQLGRVGITEKEAKDQGRRIRLAKMPMSAVARALEVDETRGVMKVIVDGDSDEILGCAILGIDGGEMMSMIEIAMMGHLPYTALRDGIFAHPLLAESLNNVFGSLEEA